MEIEVRVCSEACPSGNIRTHGGLNRGDLGRRIRRLPGLLTGGLILRDADPDISSVEEVVSQTEYE